MFQLSFPTKICHDSGIFQDCESRFLKLFDLNLLISLFTCKFLMMNGSSQVFDLFQSFVQPPGAISMLKAKMIHHCLDAFLHCSRSPEQHSAVVKTKKVQLGKGAMCMHGLPQNQRFLKSFFNQNASKGVCGNCATTYTHLA